MPTNTEPVATAGAITTVIESGLVLLVSLGILDITEDQMHQIMAFVIAVGGVVGPLWWARQRVTPLVDAKDEDGTALVRAGTQSPALAETRARRRGA